MYILDTDICIYTIKRKPAQVLERFAGIEVGEVGISAITLAELVFGARKSRYFEKNINSSQFFYEKKLTIKRFYIQIFFFKNS